MRRHPRDTDKLVVRILHEQNGWLHISELSRMLNPSNKSYNQDCQRAVERLYASGYLLAREAGNRIEVRLRGVGPLDNIIMRRLKGTSGNKWGLPQPNAYRFWRYLKNEGPGTYRLVTKDGKGDWLVTKPSDDVTFQRYAPLTAIPLENGFSYDPVQDISTKMKWSKRISLPERWKPRDYLAYCYSRMEVKPAPWTKNLKKADKVGELRDSVPTIAQAIGTAMLVGYFHKDTRSNFPLEDEFRRDFDGTLHKVLEQLELEPNGWHKEVRRMVAFYAQQDTPLGWRVYEAMEALCSQHGP